MSAAIASVLWGLLWPPFGGLVVATVFRHRSLLLPSWILNAKLAIMVWTVMACWPALRVAWWDDAGAGASLLIALYVRRRKGRRRRVAKLLGAKARALRGALIWRQRDAWPSPVLVPVPR